jgi:hypothetical protein
MLVDGVVVEKLVDCFVGGHLALDGIEKADDGHTSCTKRPTASEESTPFGQTIAGASRPCHIGRPLALSAVR